MAPKLADIKSESWLDLSSIHLDRTSKANTNASHNVQAKTPRPISSIIVSSSHNHQQQPRETSSVQRENFPSNPLATTDNEHLLIRYRQQSYLNKNNNNSQANNKCKNQLASSISQLSLRSADSHSLTQSVQLSPMLKSKRQHDNPTTKCDQKVSRRCKTFDHSDHDDLNINVMSIPKHSSRLQRFKDKLMSKRFNHYNLNQTFDHFGADDTIQGDCRDISQQANNNNAKLKRSFSSLGERLNSRLSLLRHSWKQFVFNYNHQFDSDTHLDELGCKPASARPRPSSAQASNHYHRDRDHEAQASSFDRRQQTELWVAMYHRDHQNRLSDSKTRARVRDQEHYYQGCLHPQARHYRPASLQVDSFYSNKQQSANSNSSIRLDSSTTNTTLVDCNQVSEDLFNSSELVQQKPKELSRSQSTSDYWSSEATTANRSQLSKTASFAGDATSSSSSKYKRELERNMRALRLNRPPAKTPQPPQTSSPVEVAGQVRPQAGVRSQAPVQTAAQALARKPSLAELADPNAEYYSDVAANANARHSMLGLVKSASLTSNNVININQCDINSQSNQLHHQFNQHQPINMDYEYDSEQFDDLDDDYAIPSDESACRLHRSQVELVQMIGEGQKGYVFLGKLQSRDGKQILDVAIKTLKYETRSLIEKLMQEAAMMRQLEHAHIIRFIGVCPETPALIAMELAQFGQLKSYLRQFESIICVSQLVLFSFQISTALSYLESKNYVHRDVAARNVLVCGHNCVKLADFGLSRCLQSMDGCGQPHSESHYVSMSPAKLPVRWLAPESLSFRRFTSASDVWMFAVCVWEIMHLGQLRPWPQIRNQQVLSAIESGQRLARPSSCPTRLYKLLLQCWSYAPVHRPKFKDIKQSLWSVYLNERTREQLVVEQMETEMSRMRLRNCQPRIHSEDLVARNKPTTQMHTTSGSASASERPHHHRLSGYSTNTSNSTPSSSSLRSTLNRQGRQCAPEASQLTHHNQNQRSRDQQHSLTDIVASRWTPLAWARINQNKNNEEYEGLHQPRRDESAHSSLSRSSGQTREVCRHKSPKQQQIRTEQDDLEARIQEEQRLALHRKLLGHIRSATPAMRPLNSRLSQVFSHQNQPRPGLQRQRSLSPRTLASQQNQNQELHPQQTRRPKGETVDQSLRILESLIDSHDCVSGSISRTPTNANQSAPDQRKHHARSQQESFKTRTREVGSDISAGNLASPRNQPQPNPLQRHAKGLGQHKHAELLLFEDRKRT